MSSWKTWSGAESSGTGREVYALLNADSKKVRNLSTDFGNLAVFTAPSPDRTRTNEDSCAVIPVNDTVGVFAVADGMGGHRGGDQASRIAIETLAESLVYEEEAVNFEHGLRPHIISAIEMANDRIIDLGIGAGSTISIVELVGNVARFYTVGDSSSIVMNGKGELKFKTVEQSAVGFGVEAGLIQEERAMQHEARHVLLNSLGTPEMRIEVSAPVELNSRDVIVTASDGLFDNMSTDEILRAAAKGRVGQRVQEMVDICRRRMETPENNVGKPDDLTIVLFRYS